MERGAAELLEIQDTCKNVRRQSFEKLCLSVIIATNMDSLDDYDYRLPKELIAQYPTATRGESRLLVVNRESGELSHARIADLPSLLTPDDALVLNDTRVVPARLRGTRIATGGKWEGLFVEAAETGHWKILSKTRGKIVSGERVQLMDRWGTSRFTLTFESKLQGGLWIVTPDSKSNFVEALELVGEVPLPPYIRGGKMVAEDLATYQTVYANEPGAVAAPTAGLHFTNELLGAIAEQGTAICNVTLHVGIGTFRPIEVESLNDHEMHSEWGRLSAAVAETLNGIHNCDLGRIVSVGTTAVRVLETAGTTNGLEEWNGDTNLFIKPGYQFKAVDALLTNFHLPKSSLLVLVRTFGGDDLIKEAYAKAIEMKYRFYSYGDAMLII